MFFVSVILLIVMFGICAGFNRFSFVLSGVSCGLSFFLLCLSKSCHIVWGLFGFNVLFVVCGGNVGYGGLEWAAFMAWSSHVCFFFFISLSQFLGLCWRATG